MLPKRLNYIRPWLASCVHARFERPPISEMLYWLLRPGKESRARQYIRHVETDGDFLCIEFFGHVRPLYYPKSASWEDFCATVDECFNPRNWHHFLNEPAPVVKEDVVLDCGAAEGLFSYVVASHVARVYAIEPVPFWHAGLRRSFMDCKNVEIVPYGLGHKGATMRMTDREIMSRISSTGELEVDIRTIDALFEKDRVTFIKADVEGFEFPLLLGAEEVIRANRPKLSLTVYHPVNHHLEILEYLRAIHPDYAYRTRGIAENGNPMLLQVY